MFNSLAVTPLSESLKRKDLSQKYLAHDTKTPQATVSDHVLGKQPVSIEKSKKYADSLNDSKFNLEVAYLFFGTISAMTGNKYQNSPLALDVLQKKESNERKAKKELALEVSTLNDGHIDHDDRAVLVDYANEFLDEIMIEMTMIVSIVEKCDMSLMDLVEERMPYWVNKGYMRKDR